MLGTVLYTAGTVGLGANFFQTKKHSLHIHNAAGNIAALFVFYKTFPLSTRKTRILCPLFANSSPTPKQTSQK